MFTRNLEHVTFSRVMTFEINFFRKIEVNDGLYNYLICLIIAIFFQSPSQKDFFHDQNEMEVFKKFETKTSLTWTWKNMPTSISNLLS